MTRQSDAKYIGELLKTANRLPVVLQDDFCQIVAKSVAREVPAAGPPVPDWHLDDSIIDIIARRLHAGRESVPLLSSNDVANLAEELAADEPPGTDIQPEERAKHRLSLTEDAEYMFRQFVGGQPEESLSYDRWRRRAAQVQVAIDSFKARHPDIKLSGPLQLLDTPGGRDELIRATMTVGELTNQGRDMAVYMAARDKTEGFGQLVIKLALDYALATVRRIWPDKHQGADGVDSLAG